MIFSLCIPFGGGHVELALHQKKGFVSSLEVGHTVFIQRMRANCVVRVGSVPEITSQGPTSSGNSPLGKAMVSAFERASCIGVTWDAHSWPGPLTPRSCLSRSGVGLQELHF